MLGRGPGAPQVVIGIGLIQVSLILIAALLLFEVPMQGSPALLYLVVSLFIAANLTLGITFSSLARNPRSACASTSAPWTSSAA